MVPLGLLGSSFISLTGKPTNDGRFRVRADEFRGGGDVAPPVG